MNYYVSTLGSDSNVGTQDKPFKTLQKAATLALVGGDSVFIKPDGIYKSGATSDNPQYAVLIRGKIGTSDKRIFFGCDPVEFLKGNRVQFDCGDYLHKNDFTGIQIMDCAYLTVKGIRVFNIPQLKPDTGKEPSFTHGFWVAGNAGGFITLDTCEADHIGNAGFRLDNTSDASFINCDAHHIDNPYNVGVQQHGGSDGFGRWNTGNTSQRTLYKNCRAWFCSDDGWDCNNSNGSITYDGCWAFWNGYVQDVFPLTHTDKNGVAWGDGNGFKLAGDQSTSGKTTTRFINNCLSFENFGNGFDQNAGQMQGQFTNNTAFSCGNMGFAFYKEPGDFAHVIDKNIAYKTRLTNNAWGSAKITNNDWQVSPATDADFISVSSKGIDGARQADGSLPVLNFLRVKDTSKLKGIGYQWGTGGVIPPPDTNKPPVVSTDYSISLPKQSYTINLTGTASDPEAGAMTYKWEQTAGPAAVLTNSDKVNATASITDPGVYKFRLTVTDAKGLSTASETSITIK